MSEALDRLARHYGIEFTYTDIGGRHRHAPPATERALLTAMGVACGSDAEIAASLQEAEERPWRRPLPPVAVLREGGEVAVPVSLPQADRDRHLPWQVTAEDGSEHRGRVQFGDGEEIATATVDGEAYQRRRLVLPIRLPLGYHDLRIDGDECLLIVTPERAFEPHEVLGTRRAWGFGVQLYGLRSRRNWGIGDFSDLAAFAARSAQEGAEFVGVNPIHALFPADPNHFGPYGPSSRLFLNVLYIDVERVPDLAQSPAAQAALADPDFHARCAAARSAELVDYPAVAALKMPVLEHLYESFRRHHLDQHDPTPRAAAFLAFRDEAAPYLARHALFDALHEHFFGADHGRWAWETWPEPYRDPDSAEVARFADDNRRRVEFFEYLQWIADEQLAEAHQAGHSAGMAIGLYRDLAVAVSPGGSMAWSNPGIILRGASVGAPPDDFNMLGQNWGLAGPSPHGLRESAYRPFVAILRANMRHTGALRIDHVMALQRLYWIPDGVGANQGAYIAYPFEDMLGILALESRRNCCLVVGEDLGTVPEGFRPALQRAGILSYRVLWFERDDQGLISPERYREDAVAVVSTHDLPTLRGYWTDHDFRWRTRLGLWPDDHSREAAHAARARDREALLAALKQAGLLATDWRPDDYRSLAEALHRYVAAAPSRLLQVQIEDAIGELEQINLPGTFDEHPNWRRKPHLEIEEVFDRPAVQSLMDALRALRPAER